MWPCVCHIDNYHVAQDPLYRGASAFPSEEDLGGNAAKQDNEDPDTEYMVEIGPGGVARKVKVQKKPKRRARSLWDISEDSLSHLNLN